MKDLFGEVAVANDNPTGANRKPMGEWQPIDTAPKDRPVDLWIAAYGYDSVLIENCRWDAGAVIPDWYRDGEDGQLWLGVKIIYHATHWKEAGAAEGPHHDGGPPIRARTWIGDSEERWPAEMRARRKAYHGAIERGEIDKDLIYRDWQQGTRVIQGGKF